MSEMASWFKVKEGIIFLTDKDVIAYHDRAGSSTERINWYNFVGHGGMMKVFNIPDRGQTHHEGFVNMPDVIKKTILNGEMNMLFAHAGNLQEATPEFIPLMTRLAERFSNVREQLRENPYRTLKLKKGSTLSNFIQMKVGIDNNFKGSTIGRLLRSNTCQEESMMLALRKVRNFMDQYSDRHHYFNIINNPNVTKKVLRYMLDNVSHSDVRDGALDRMDALKGHPAVLKKVKALSVLKIKTIKKGRAKIRTTV